METLAGDPIQGACQLRWATKTGEWLTVHPSTVNGTELGVQEWRDSLFQRYGLEPPELPHYCNVCNSTFSICHALDCNKGGLVTARHNKICDRVADLAGKYFTPSHMHNNPLIFTGCAVNRTKEKPDRIKAPTVPADMPPIEATEQKGELLISDLW